MSKYLMLDIGAGTLDILHYDDESGLHYKAVVKSPVLTLAEKARGLPGNLLVCGSEMGGGPISEKIILATGPKRRLIEKSRLPVQLGAPLGDHMMTGTAGLFEAIRRRKGLDPIPSW